jgi:hypothetical protein
MVECEQQDTNPFAASTYRIAMLSSLTTHPDPSPTGYVGEYRNWTGRLENDSGQIEGNMQYSTREFMLADRLQWEMMSPEEKQDFVDQVDRIDVEENIKEWAE